MEKPQGEPKKLSRFQQIRRQDILDASLKIFDRKGFDAAKMSDIAQEAGVAKGTLYLYFETKAALLEGVIQSAIIPTLQSVDETAQSHSGTAEELLVRQMQIMARRIASPEMRTLLRHMIAGGREQHQGLIESYYENVIEPGLKLLRQTLKQGVDSGEFRKEVADMDPLVLLGAPIYTTVWKLLFEEISPIDTEHLVNDLLELVLLGLKSG